MGAALSVAPAAGAAFVPVVAPRTAVPITHGAPVAVIGTAAIVRQVRKHRLQV